MFLREEAAGPSWIAQRRWLDRPALHGQEAQEPPGSVISMADIRVQIAPIFVFSLVRDSHFIEEKRPKSGAPRCLNSHATFLEMP